MAKEIKVVKTWVATGETQDMTLDEAVTEIVTQGHAAEKFAQVTLQGKGQIRTATAVYLAVEVEKPEREPEREEPHRPVRPR